MFGWLMRVALSSSRRNLAPGSDCDCRVWRRPMPARTMRGARRPFNCSSRFTRRENGPDGLPMGSSLRGRLESLPCKGVRKELLFQVKLAVADHDGLLALVAIADSFHLRNVIK